MSWLTRIHRSAGYVVPATEWNQQVDNENFLYSRALILPSSALTIAGGIVTVSNLYSKYTVDTEGGAGTDDLTGIDGGTPGQILVLSRIGAAHVTTVKNGGTLYLAGSDFVMTDTLQMLVLMCGSGASIWVELCRANDT